MTRALRLTFVGLVASAALGCGSAEPTAPKESLSDKDKQQLKELNQQREDEWGSTNKKKK